MAAGYEMRVSDAEREAAAAELREHFASGRLDQEELDERLSAALTARTRGDLNALFADLPSAGHARAGAGALGGGPAFGGPFGGPFGAADARREWQERRGAMRAGMRPRFGRAALAAFLIWALFIVGILGVFGVFGIGSGRPIGIVLILAAFALVRRLLFIIFGRGRRGSRGGRRRGPRRRRF